MRVFRLILVLTLLFAGLLLFLRNQSRITAARAYHTQQQSRLSLLSGQIAEFEADLRAFKADLHSQARTRDSALTALSAHARDLAKTDPEALWVDPPPALPHWNPESPYLWLPKEILMDLPFHPFLRNGELNPAVADLLTIHPQTRRDLDRLSRALVDQYRAIELANVQTTTNHLPGIDRLDGDKHTIQITPSADLGARLRDEFTSAIHSALGEQRASIVLDRAQPWIAKHFSNFAAEPKTISVARTPNGYSISTKAADSWSSVGGVPHLNNHIPQHLLHHFAHLQEPNNLP